MGSSIQKQKSDNTVTIKINGRFDFDCYKDFREAYETENPDGHFVIDLSTVDYLDSSALGMMIAMKRHIGMKKNNIEITRFSNDVGQILEIANFSSMFVLKQ